MGGNDEREQTLNQLLAEMDGFGTNTPVIVLAATNRPEILDAALLRAGRFDRQVLVDKPDYEGRLAILKIHSKDVKLSGKVDMAVVAKATAGLAGADLANIINEAALLAGRQNKKVIEQSDLMEAIERAFVGLEKKNRKINELGETYRLLPRKRPCSDGRIDQRCDTRYQSLYHSPRTWVHWDTRSTSLTKRTVF